MGSKISSEDRKQVESTSFSGFKKKKLQLISTQLHTGLLYSKMLQTFALNDAHGLSTILHKTLCWNPALFESCQFSPKLKCD